MNGHSDILMTTIKHIFIIVTIGLLLTSCSKESKSPTDHRSPTAGNRIFDMGFTDFPHANSLEALLAAYHVIEQDGDMAVMHFDDGIPWREALDGTPYHAAYLEALYGKRSLIPAGHTVYLAVTPIAFSRDRIADYRGAAGEEPLPPPWDERAFDHPAVIEAFTRHCRNMIEIFSPDYFAYAIEANMLIELAPDGWDDFVTLADSVYGRLKAIRPDLPIFITFQAQSYYDAPGAQRDGIQQVVPFTDIIAISSYPFSAEPDLELIPSNFPAAITGLAPEKPVAIAETAWSAEDVTAPYPMSIPSNEQTQRLYVEWMLSECLRQETLFVCWFFTRDYDDFWETDLQYDDRASLLRLWKDTGLYDGDGGSRPALESWRKVLAYTRE
jgi:hypothetical protein